MLDLNSKSTTRQYLFSFRKARESFVRTQKQENREIKKWLKTFESRDEVRWAEPRFLRLDWARIWMNPKNIYLLARPVLSLVKSIPKKLILEAKGPSDTPDSTWTLGQDLDERLLATLCAAGIGLGYDADRRRVDSVKNAPFLLLQVLTPAYPTTVTGFCKSKCLVQSFSKFVGILISFHLV